jgi:hypothetical protein
MSRKTVARCALAFVLGGVCLAPGVIVARVWGEPAKAPEPQAEVTSIKGTCTFGKDTTPWTAKLKARGDGVYDAEYQSIWGGKPGSYVGTITTDLKTKISGRGKATGGRANGTFEFSGTYGTNGVAKCNYKEIGGGRKGKLTAEMPK